MVESFDTIASTSSPEKSCTLLQMRRRKLHAPWNLVTRTFSALWLSLSSQHRSFRRLSHRSLYRSRWSRTHRSTSEGTSSKRRRLRSRPASSKRFGRLFWTRQRRLQKSCRICSSPSVWWQMREICTLLSLLERMTFFCRPTWRTKVFQFGVACWWCTRALLKLANPKTGWSIHRSTRLATCRTTCFSSLWSLTLTRQEWWSKKAQITWGQATLSNSLLLSTSSQAACPYPSSETVFRSAKQFVRKRLRVTGRLRPKVLEMDFQSRFDFLTLWL